MCGNSASSLRRIPKKKSFNHGTWMLVTKTRLPHHREPNEFVFGPTSFGVLSWRLDADNYETDEELKKIREERGYSCVDFGEVFPEKLPNYEEKIKDIFEEHFHTDEEIRYCVAGSGKIGYPTNTHTLSHFGYQFRPANFPYLVRLF
ncbi:hypothetical protein H0E87_018772 [Populus deltoides]|uniref:acireductone dioxygenase (Fe(2+)-requiring) n=1 Tax=Populus deltoides TaxID=3696 RepID=A0A8T2XSU6_POPDE|nr:hypothetical protein H0E87_018772 [Populus deltoides]